MNIAAIEEGLKQVKTKRQAKRHISRKHKKTLRFIQGILIGVKAILGVVAFKLTEYAIHIGGFQSWSLASIVSASLIIPAIGLAKLAEILEDI